MKTFWLFLLALFWSSVMKISAARSSHQKQLYELLCHLLADTTAIHFQEGEVHKKYVWLIAEWKGLLDFRDVIYYFAAFIHTTHFMPVHHTLFHLYCCLWNLGTPRSSMGLPFKGAIWVQYTLVDFQGEIVVHWTGTLLGNSLCMLSPPGLLLISRLARSFTKRSFVSRIC